MKNFIKFVLILLILTLNLQTSANANRIDRIINKSDINKSSISVSVKDIKNGQTVYRLNNYQPQMPASTLKLVTSAVSLDKLGYDFEFKTQLYKTSNNELYLKLSGDPFFSSKDLENLLEIAKQKKITEPKAFYIDDLIFDDTEWGEGWQWDDDLNPLMPKFSSYNIDNNLLNIIITPTNINSPANIKTEKFYPVTFMNQVTTGNDDQIQIKRNNSISPDIINIEGIVSKKAVMQIPVNNPKRYFKLRLEEAIRNNKIDYYGKFVSKKLPQSNIYLVGEVNRNISDIIFSILKNSNNLASESLFKNAGAQFAGNTGSVDNAVKMLNNYFERNNINTDNIRIVDGSGVSKNNIVTADFMSSFLVLKSKDEQFVNSLPKPGEGTLKTRMLYFKDNLQAKTGTLSDVSAIAGYITSRRGKTYAFDIMINDPKSKPAEKKSLEEYILREIYSNF